VGAGEAPRAADADRLRWATHNAEAISGLRFSVYVGPAKGDDPRAEAEQLHRALDQPGRTVLVWCDPQSHALEVVTGAEAGRHLDGWACALAVASMQSSFVAGDVVGGLLHGVQQLGNAARAPRTLHSR